MLTSSWRSSWARRSCCLIGSGGPQTQREAAIGRAKWKRKPEPAVTTGSAVSPPTPPAEAPPKTRQAAQSAEETGSPSERLTCVATRGVTTLA
jgi:hypothetical protein